MTSLNSHVSHKTHKHISLYIPFWLLAVFTLLMGAQLQRNPWGDRKVMVFFAQHKIGHPLSSCLWPSSSEWSLGELLTVKHWVVNWRLTGYWNAVRTKSGWCFKPVVSSISVNFGHRAQRSYVISLALLCAPYILTYIRDARMRGGYRRAITWHRRRARTYAR